MTELLAHDLELVVVEAGRLRLPESLVARLRLAEGDLLAFTPGALSIRIDLYRDFLADNWAALAPAIRWTYLFDFLWRPLGAIGPGGTVVMPAEVFRWAAGARLLLQIVPRGSAHVLYLYRAISVSG